MQASVVGEEFVGATAVIHLEGADGLELKAQKSHDELDQLNLTPGAKIWLSWRPEASHILPGEDGGPATRFRETSPGVMPRRSRKARMKVKNRRTR